MEVQINVRVPKKTKRVLQMLAIKMSDPDKIVRVSDVVRDIIENSADFKAAKEQLAESV